MGNAMREQSVRILRAATLAAVLVLFGAEAAFAQPNEVKSARDKVLESAEQVQSLGIGAQQSISDFEVKQKALERVLGFTAAELRGVRDRLAGFSAADSEFLLLAEQVSESLGAFEDFLGGARTELAAVRSGEDLKAFAVRFESWRTAVYAPELRKAIEFALVFQNARSIDLAEARLAKFSAYLKRAKALKLGTQWESLFTQAGLELVAARELEEQMREFLRAYLPQEVSLAEEKLEARSVAGAPAKQGVTSESLTSVQDLAEKSWDHVKSAYKLFIRIAQGIQGKR